MTTAFSLSYAALWLLAIFQSIVILGVVRTVYQLQQGNRHAGVPDEEGTGEAPVFTATDVAGRNFDSTEFDDHLGALLFVSAECPTCTATLSHVEGLKAKTDGHVVVVCRADHQACAGLAERYGLTVRVIADEDLRISKLFGSPAVPAALLIGNGRILSIGHPLKHEELNDMVDEQIRANSESDGLRSLSEPPMTTGGA